MFFFVVVGVSNFEVILFSRETLLSFFFSKCLPGYYLKKNCITIPVVCVAHNKNHCTVYCGSALSINSLNPRRLSSIFSFISLLSVLSSLSLKFVTLIGI